MDTYRAFILDDRDRILRAEVFSAASDEAAIEAARPFWQEAEIEIWHGSRRVVRVLQDGTTVPNPAAGSS